MPNFNVILGYQGRLFRDFLWSDRPTDPISGNAFDAKRKKKEGDGPKVVIVWNVTLEFACFLQNVWTKLTKLDRTSPLKNRLRACLVVYHLHGQTNQFTVWVNVKGNRLEIVFTEKSPRRPETGIIDGFKKNEMWISVSHIPSEKSRTTYTCLVGPGNFPLELLKKSCSIYILTRDVNCTICSNFSPRRFLQGNLYVCSILCSLSN